MARSRPTMTGELRQLQQAIAAGKSATQAARDLNRCRNWAWAWCKRLEIDLRQRHPKPPARAQVAEARKRLGATIQQVKSAAYGLDAARFSPPASAVSGDGKEKPGTGPGLSLEFSM